ncbi:MAG: hypothetical protein ACRDTN_11900 [Mycobacterium sp.]
MTTTTEKHRSQVPIAGVPWPVYKLVALVVALVALVVVGAASGSAATAVLTAAGTGTVVWLLLGPLHRSRR